MKVAGRDGSRVRILVLRVDGIGDTLNSTPAISALRDAYPDAHISVAVRPHGAEVLRLNPHVDEVLVYDEDGEHRGLIGKVRFFRRLRAGHYDLAVVLRNSSLCNFMACISGARYRVGRKSERKMFSFALTDGVRSHDPKGTKHEIDRNLDVVRLVGAEGECAGLVLRLSEDERAWARGFITRQRIKEPIVGMHPGGSSTDKLWPADRFARVADWLMTELQASVILFCGPGEEALAEDVQRSMARPPVLATGLSLRQLAALTEKCSLFICNDSGPMHIAAALNVPTVAVFGPTDHIRWKPRNRRAVVVRRNMDCWPCSAHKCKRSFECIKSLPTDEVVDAVCSVLNIERSDARHRAPETY